MFSTEERERHEREICGVVEAVDRVVGPKSLVVLAIVPNEIIAEVKKCCDTRAIEVRTEDNLRSAISSLAATSPEKDSL